MGTEIENASVIIEVVEAGSEYAEEAQDEPENEVRLTRQQREMAYFNTKTTYDLKAKQRDLLDASPRFHEIMRAAHEAAAEDVAKGPKSPKWDRVEDLLRSEGII